MKVNKYVLLTVLATVISGVCAFADITKYLSEFYGKNDHLQDQRHSGTNYFGSPRLWRSRAQRLPLQTTARAKLGDGVLWPAARRCPVRSS